MRVIVFLLFTVFIARVAFADSHISEEKVKTLLNEWLDAQNIGSFDMYEKLYAQKFHGVRRSGSKKMSFDRNGWLKDREKMFKKRMSIQMRNPKIEISGTAAYVQFKQIWQSGSYRDVGDKLIVIMEENGSARIAREEMRASSIIPEQAEGDPPAKLAFAFVIKEGVVIADNTGALKTIKGKPKLESREPVYVASVSVDEDRLPSHVKSLLQKPIRVFSEKGVCETQIKGFKIISKEVPHQNQIESWRGKTTSDDMVAEAIFSSGNRYLVAITDGCSGDFASDVVMPKSVIFPGVAADSETKRQVKAAIVALPMYKKHIKPHEAKIDEETYKIFRTDFKGKASVWASAFISVGDSCGAGGAVGALWRVDELPTGRKLTWIKYLPEDPVYATDLDDDGFPDFYFHSKYTSYTGFISGKQKGDPNKRGRVTDSGNKFFEETALHDDPC